MSSWNWSRSSSGSGAADLEVARVSVVEAEVVDTIVSAGAIVAIVWRATHRAEAVYGAVSGTGGVVGHTIHQGA